MEAAKGRFAHITNFFMKFSLPSLPCLFALLGLAASPFQAPADYVLSAQEEQIAAHLVYDPGQERPSLRLDQPSPATTRRHFMEIIRDDMR